MKKSLSISDIVLLSIAGIFDFFQEIKDPGGLISSYYQNFYGFVPQRWQKINLYRIIYKNRKKQRLIKKNKKLLLTNEGKKYIENNFPVISYRIEKWDGYLYFILFDVVELKRQIRDKLRNLLKQLKFAQLQKSVWVTINKNLINLILEFKKNYHINQEIFIIKAKFCTNGNIRSLINQLWCLDDLNKKYQKIFKRYQHLITKYKKEKNHFFLLKEFAKINKDLYQITTQDPFLPSSLLPKKWFYFESLKIKRKIARIIKITHRNFAS